MPRRERIERTHHRRRAEGSVDEAKRRHPSRALRLAPAIDRILDEIDDVLEANAEQLEHVSARKRAR